MAWQGRGPWHTWAFEKMEDGREDVVVGVLCLQGAFIEHIKKLESIKELKKDLVSLKVVDVRKPEQLNGLHGLIVPGGESTTLSVFLAKNQFEQKLREWLKGPVTVWGTCAGLILFSDKLTGQKQGGQIIIGGIAVESTRNLFGRQVNSFESDVEIVEPELRDCLLSYPASLGKEPPPPSSTCHGVFIRAPGINRILSSEVRILARLCDSEKTTVAVKHDNIMATCFHPELTEDLRWHCYFIDCVLKRKSTCQ